MNKVTRILLLCSVVCMVASNPVDIGDAKYHKSHKRFRRATDVRNCDVTPPTYPETTVRTDLQLQKIRALLVTNKIDAYIVPSEDAHQSEYIAKADERRKYISGFSGSAGLAIITADLAAVWVDGRYFLQAKMELDCNWMSMESGEPNVPTTQEWLVGDDVDGILGANLQQNAKMGFDPTLLSISSYTSYKTAFDDSSKNITLKSISEENLVDLVWEDIETTKPVYTGDVLLTLNDSLTGRNWQRKIYQEDSAFENTIRSQLSEKNADALVIHKLDEIAWVFNMRGTDIPYNPMFISYAIIEMNAIRLYMYNKNIRTSPPNIQTHLAPCTSGVNCIQLKVYDDFLDDLATLGNSAKVWHSDTASYAIYELVKEENRVMEASPILLMKAKKNSVELDGVKSSCWKDSISLCELFGWIQEKIDNLPSEDGSLEYLSELTIEAEAIKVREVWGDKFTGLSFGSISAFGPHGAIIHYSSTPTTDVPVTKKGTYMLDSGSQYIDGTTDITRTMHYGTPTALEKESYTRILMGHIDLVRTVFRTGVYGRDIDSIAREPLWHNGLDYKHGTGHGIGHFLNVHEGPGRITLGYRSSEKPMIKGMLFSDEPGYYEDGAFGIRLENDMIVTEAETDHTFSYEYMTFEMVSLVPFEPTLIDYTMLSANQIDWYNMYNKRIRDEVGPNLNKRAKDWMESKTEPINYIFEINYTPVECNGSFSQHSALLSGMMAIIYAIFALVSKNVV